MAYNSMPYASGSDSWAASTLKWTPGNRVAHLDGTIGTVGQPPREPNAGETNLIWVNWDDATESFCDPATLTEAD